MQVNYKQINSIYKYSLYYEYLNCIFTQFIAQLCDKLQILIANAP